jgi:diacylglycerol kinase
VHLVAAAAVLAGAALVGVSAGGLTALVLAIGLVLATELVNTAVEAALDAAVPREHPLVGLAKDTAAAAVLVASIAALGVGIVVFGHEITGIG